MTGTTGLSAHSVMGRAHVPLLPHLPLRGSRLYILLHLPLLRVSFGLAHILCESLAHPLGYFSSEIRASTGEDPPSGFKPPSREDPLVDSRPHHEEELVTVYRP